MASPILFYTPTSCAFGCIVVLEWLNRPYRLCRVERAERAAPNFRRVSPPGQVPALLTSSFEGGRLAMTESAAILQHLAGLDPGRALAGRKGTAEIDRVNMAVSFVSSTLHPSFWPIFRPERVIADPEQHAAVRARAVELLRTRYARLDELLGDRSSFLDRPNLADAHLYGVARWGEALLDIGAEFPAVARLQKRMAEEPAVQLAHAVEEGRKARSSGQLEAQLTLDEALREMAPG